MSRIALFLIAAASFGSTLALAADPSSVKIKVYAVAISTKADCSGMTTLFTNDAPEYTDFVSNPTLGDGTPADGTYECVAIKMSDTIKYTSATTTGSCTAGTEYTRNLCRTPETSTDALSGATISCTGVNAEDDAEDILWLYLSTGTTGAGAATFQPPGSTNNGLHLSGAFVVSGDTNARFKADFRGKIDGSGSPCDVNAPDFGFSKL